MKLMTQMNYYDMEEIHVHENLYHMVTLDEFNQWKNYMILFM